LSFGEKAEVPESGRNAGLVAKFLADGEGLAIPLLSLVQLLAFLSEDAEFVVGDGHAASITEIFFNGEGPEEQVLGLVKLTALARHHPDAALIGTSEHGVLGKRWIYDGTRDPVLVTQMYALLLGEAEPQAQSISNTVDPSVTRMVTGTVGALPVEIADVADGPGSTDVTVRPDAAAGPLMLRVNRVLRPSAPGLMTGSLGHVTAEWAGPGASRLRGRFVVLRVP
jgi:hypothetical protein